MIVIIDYGMGNVGSILNMLRRIGAAAQVSSKPGEIDKADKLILPGVGTFDHGMANLSERGLIPLLNNKVLEQKCPVLGICLGMQLLSKTSEEGVLPGLGWIDAATRRFCFDEKSAHLKIPHMGWDVVKPMNGGKPLFEGFDAPPRFYFVHSYHVCCSKSEDVLGTSFYGYEFTAAVRRGNVMGTQFHPEKSHKFGMRLLRNFADS